VTAPLHAGAQNPGPGHSQTQHLLRSSGSSRPSGARALRQGRNVVLESKYGSPRIVNDGVTVAKEVELEDPVENIGAKLVRQVRAPLHEPLLCRACIDWRHVGR